MSEIVVIGWGEWDSGRPNKVDDYVGAWSVRRRFTWPEFLADKPERLFEHFEALRAAILSRRLKRGGDWHQHSGEGVPYFSDGSIGEFSYREWGDLLASVWTTEEQRRFHYMDFYMDCRLPE